jgi:4-hydroxy-4-methyl-2-oxoglutarate aldolase
MERNVVVRNIPRADPAVIARLGSAGVATVYEAQGRIGLLGPDIAPIQSGARIAGSAVTVESHPGDNIMIHAAVEMVGPGDVLVVAVTGPSIYAMVGDLLATSLRAHGCIGLVVDAGIRDSAELIEMAFPVWSRTIHAQGTVKAHPGSVNVAVSISGAAVDPGDVVVADDDGVVVVRRADAVAVLEATEQRLATEEATRARLESGELGVDFYGLRARLHDMGVEYLDTRPTSAES